MDSHLSKNDQNVLHMIINPNLPLNDDINESTNGVNQIGNVILLLFTIRF